jgi:hypothetical protein
MEPTFTTFHADAVNEHSARLDAVRELAADLMREHELYGWSLTFDQARNRAGECRRRIKQISLSEPLLTMWTPEQVRDTILHEIAHALAPPRSGHGIEWKRVCVAIGADPTRTWDPSQNESLPKRWIGTCPSGHEIYRDRRPRKPVSCTQCSPVFDANYLITWKRAT